jgi:hypothetical protein
MFIKKKIFALVKIDQPLGAARPIDRAAEQPVQLTSDSDIVQIPHTVCGGKERVKDVKTAGTTWSNGSQGVRASLSWPPNCDAERVGS